MPIKTKIFSILTILVGVLLGAAQCGGIPTNQQNAPAVESQGPKIAVKGPFARATTENGAIYLELVNTGNRTDTLLSAETNVAAATELHETKMEGDVMRMSLVSGGIEIPAGETVPLEPGGLHLMLLDLSRDLAPGDKITLTLNFEDSDPIMIEVEVREGVAMAHEHDAAAHEDAEDEHKTDDAVEVSAVNLSDGEKLKVLATTNIVGDLVRNVGGDMIELTTMLPIGADPHTFTPTPQDAASVADVHVVFVNGLHLEEFLRELIENAGGEASVVALSTNVETREFEATDGHSDEETDDHDGVDPHIWMSPANALVMVHNIEYALSELDRANTKTFEANADAYEAQLKELDAWVKTQIESIPAENREMVTDHDALGYYAARYGLEIVGTVLPANTTNAEPSAQELAKLQEIIQKFDTQAVFVGTTVNPVLATRVAEDTGIKLIPLYTGSLGKAGSGAETYLNLIRYNTTAIVAALK